MGTTWSLRIDNPRLLPLDVVREATEQTLDSVVAQMSTWEPDSTISRFNRSSADSTHRLEPEFAAVLGCALDWAVASRGAIDPTIGPLVSLWGFGAQAASVAPSEPELARARGQVDWQRLPFDRATASLRQPGGMALDLSGIAKGFAVDKVAERLQALGFANFLVEIGGELRGFGHRPGGGRWRVQLESLPGVSEQVDLADMAIATSGDRWQVREEGSRRWSHTIDPRSGQPVESTLASVTVLHPQCMHADALATVLMVLGAVDGIEFARQHDVAALWMCRDGDHRRRQASEAWLRLAA
jgi:FAD:protein FMN transferase